MPTRYTQRSVVLLSLSTPGLVFAASRRIVFLTLLAATLAVTSRAQTTTIPLGSYTAVIPQDVRVGNLTFLGGEYQLTLLEGGKYQLGRNNFITLSGAYSVSGAVVKFASPATMDNCSGEGMYQWAGAGNRLTLIAATARVDSCVERLVGLTGASFFKDDPASNVWKSIGPTGGQFNAVIIHDGKIYAGGGGGGFLGTTGGGVFISADNGQTWARPESGVLVTGSGWWMDSRGGNLYASADQVYGILRSTDEGRSWQYINRGFDARWGIRWYADGGTLYVGTPNGVYVSNSLVNRASTVSAASFSATAIVEKGIVAAFGPNLSLRTANASSQPLPTELGGTTVKVRDSLGVERLASLFHVSAEQVNFQIPAGTAAGSATITITNGDGIGATGDINIVARAPAIFTLSANGSGPAAAVDALTGAAAPFNATQANGQPNIIAVWGTGLGADATDLDGNVNTSVTVTIGGRAATVQYAGRAPGFVGANQFNIALPAGLASGTHTLIITRGGVASNAATITIR
jgi:uncharacterized protein (TIGR03437 family)